MSEISDCIKMDCDESVVEQTMLEYEQMQSLQLFSADEISKIKMTRDEFTCKIGESCSIKDYLEFIKYERSLVATIKQRIIQNKVTANHTILSIIGDHIKQIYDTAIEKYPKNIRFWNEYVKFLEAFKYTVYISSVYDRMLQFHSDKADVWVQAILWQHNENFNHDHIKSLITRATELHPESKQLFLTFFQIELENKCGYCEMEALEHASAVYTRTKELFTNIEFYIDMLKIADKFEYASSIQRNILNDMREMFPRNEFLWNMLAQRELKGSSSICCPTKSLKSIKTEKYNSENEERKFNQSIEKLNISEHPAVSAQHHIKEDGESDKEKEKCIESLSRIYEEAVKMVNTPKMWDYYLNAMIEQNKDSSTNKRLISTKQTLLCKAFQSAEELHRLSENHYIQYIELMYTLNPIYYDKDILCAFSNALKLYENSVAIWLLHMRFYIQQKNLVKVQEIFNAGRTKLGARSHELWKLYAIFLKTCPKNLADPQFKHFITELSQQKYPSFNKLKVIMLEYIEITSPIEEVRKVYHLFINNYPACYEVHEFMADLEERQLKPNKEAERSCLEAMISNFGKNRPDVWIRYIRFEQIRGDSKKVMHVHERALASIQRRELLQSYYACYNGGKIIE